MFGRPALLSGVALAAALFAARCPAGMIGGPSLAPARLPAGFSPWSGVKDAAGTYVIGGEFQGKPAYVTVTASIELPPAVSPVRVLNSLTVQAGGSDPVGRVADVVVDSSGQVRFIGHSRSPLGLPSAQVPGQNAEGTIWSMATGVGEGVGTVPGGTPNSILMAGNTGGFAVGGSSSTPAVWDGMGLTALPGGDAAALSISRDGSVIGGSRYSTGAAYWTRQPDGSYQFHSAEMPTTAITMDGSMIRGSEGGWLAGSVLDVNTGGDTAAIWSSADGRVLHDFSALGDIDQQFIRVGVFEGTRVASFNFLDPSVGPALYIEGDPGVTPLASLLGSPTLVGSNGRIIDLFDGSLGVVFQGQDDFGGTAFYVSSWVTTPAAVPEPSGLVLLGFLGVAGAAVTRFRRRSV